MSRRTPRVAFPPKNTTKESSDGIRVLFLDFDGVINTYRGYRAWEQERSFRKYLATFFQFLRWNKPIKFLKNLCVNYRKYKDPTVVSEFVNSIPGKIGRLYNRLFWKYLSHDDGFDKYSIGWVVKLLQEYPDLRIVISSVWRVNGVKYLRRLLALYGIPPEKILSSTPRVDSYRGKEVKAWLHGLERNPELLHFMEKKQKDDEDFANTPHDYHKKVISFAIVDDDSDLKPFTKRFVQTDGYDGIGHKEYVKLIDILNRPLRSRYE